MSGSSIVRYQSTRQVWEASFPHSGSPRVLDFLSIQPDRPIPWRLTPTGFAISRFCMTSEGRRRERVAPGSNEPGWPRALAQPTLLRWSGQVARCGLLARRNRAAIVWSQSRPGSQRRPAYGNWQSFRGRSRGPVRRAPAALAGRLGAGPTVPANVNGSPWTRR